jgi:hypothetical protein
MCSNSSCSALPPVSIVRSRAPRHPARGSSLRATSTAFRISAFRCSAKPRSPTCSRSSRRSARCESRTSSSAFPIPCAFITKALEPPDPLMRLAEAAGVTVHPLAAQDGRVLPAHQAVSRRAVRPHHHHARLARRRVRRGALLHRQERHRQVGVCARPRRTWPSAGRRRPRVRLAPRQRRAHRTRARAAAALHGDPRRRAARHPAIFGIHAVRQQKRLEVVVVLEEWDADAQVDRTGLDVQTIDILGVEIRRSRCISTPARTSPSSPK